MDAQGPALYVFAHNDDELSAFLRLRDDVRQGREVHVAWLTESLFRARPGERPRESTRAMALLGVPAERLHFLGASLGVTGNGTLLVRIAEVIERLTALVHELAPVTIATTAFEGGHVEHDAAHVAAVLAARRAGSTARLVEVPWYNGYRSRTIAFFRPLPGAGPHESDRVGIAELKLFWRLVRCYPSQAPQLWPGLGGALAAVARRSGRCRRGATSSARTPVGCSTSASSAGFAADGSRGGSSRCSAGRSDSASRIFAGSWPASRERSHRARREPRSRVDRTVAASQLLGREPELARREPVLREPGEAVRVVAAEKEVEEERAQARRPAVGGGHDEADPLRTGRQDGARVEHLKRAQQRIGLDRARQRPERGHEQAAEREAERHGMAGGRVDGAHAPIVEMELADRIAGAQHGAVGEAARGAAIDAPVDGQHRPHALRAPVAEVEPVVDVERRHEHRPEQRLGHDAGDRACLPSGHRASSHSPQRPPGPSVSAGPGVARGPAGLEVIS